MSALETNSPNWATVFSLLLKFYFFLSYHQMLLSKIGRMYSFGEGIVILMWQFADKVSRSRVVPVFTRDVDQCLWPNATENRGICCPRIACVLKKSRNLGKYQNHKIGKMNS